MRFTKALRYTLFFVVVGLFATAVVFVAQRQALKAYRENLPLASLSENLKNQLALAQFRFEKILAGDKTLTFQQHVQEPLTASRNLLQAWFEGKSTPLGILPPLQDENSKAIVKETVISLEKLQEAAARRLEFGLTNSSDSTGSIAPPGSIGPGVAWTEKYTTVQANIDKLAQYTRRELDQDNSDLTMYTLLAVALVAAGFALLTWTLYRLKSQSDEQTQENNRKLQDESKRVQTLSNFIESVSAGNYNMELNAEGEGDNLTNTLIAMRDKLKQNAEDDRRRNWATTGLARIGEILRASTSSTTELYDNIIKFVVKYTNSNQGGMFLLNDDHETNAYLELVACYAFERKKYITRRVDIGDGLVGQCFIEGERVVLFEVPDEYISITSGLGGANPNALVLIPMKVNDKTYGVIELASFTRYEDYEIELVEKLAESIASTISAVRVNDTTRILLEKTQQQAEEMKSQEEEIRQNMEELEATQEEMRRKQMILEKELTQSQEQAEVLRRQEKTLTESQDTLQAIVDNIPRAIFWKDKDLRFMGCNKIFANIAGARSTQELIGKTDFDMAWSAQADAYRKDDMEVMRNRKAKLDIEEVNVNSDGEESWVLTSKVPIINKQNEVVAILGMFEDITGRKRLEADITRKLEERESALLELKALKQQLEMRKL